MVYWVIIGMASRGAHKIKAEPGSGVTGAKGTLEGPRQDSGGQTAVPWWRGQAGQSSPGPATSLAVTAATSPVVASSVKTGPYQFILLSNAM